MLAAGSHSDGYKVKRKQQKARLMTDTCVAWAATSTELRVNASEVEKQSKTTSMGGLQLLICQIVSCPTDFLFLFDGSGCILAPCSNHSSISFFLYCHKVYVNKKGG